LTRNTLASGATDKRTGKPVEDLGSRINNDDVMFLIPDLASLISKRSDEKNEIWGQLRNLYDGFISKDTGTGVTRKYDNCNVTLLACATEKIRGETLIHNQLGTRELLYDTDGMEIDSKIEKALKNERFEAEMKKELGAIVREFLSTHKYKEIDDKKIPIGFLSHSAKRLSVLRATAEFGRNMELMAPVSIETPTRCAKQFKRVYKALMSLDPAYPESRAKEIICRLVNSSGDPIMQKVVNYLRNNHSFHYVQEISDEIKINRRAVSPRLEMLWNMGYVTKEHDENRLKYCWI
jgi:hypothetical protein